MTFRTPPAKTREYAEVLRDSLSRERVRIEALAAAREERAVAACEQAAPWCWAEAHGALGLFRDGKYPGPNLEARMRAIDYREFPEKLRGELFPPVPLPEIPPLPPIGANLDPYFAELDELRARLDALEEDIRVSRDVSEFEARSRPEHLERVVTRNEADMQTYARWRRERQRSAAREATVLAEAEARAAAASVAPQWAEGRSGAADLAAFLIVGVPVLGMLLLPFAQFSPWTLAVILVLSPSLGMVVSYRARKK
ncbi:MAG: hypothetical protein R3B72_49730 [Polyangiaceae bacterium]